MTKEYVDSRKFLERRLREIYAGYGMPPGRSYGAEELSHIRITDRETNIPPILSKMRISQKKYLSLFRSPSKSR